MSMNCFHSHRWPLEINRDEFTVVGECEARLTTTLSASTTVHRHPGLNVSRRHGAFFKRTIYCQKVLEKSHIKQNEAEPTNTTFTISNGYWTAAAELVESKTACLTRVFRSVEVRNFEVNVSILEFTQTSQGSQRMSGMAVAHSRNFFSDKEELHWNMQWL